MGKYRFDEIAINSTQKKKPIEEDRFHYVGLEHIDPECFEIQQYGSEVAPVGEKLVMKKGDILFGKRRAYQRKVAIAPCDGIFSAHGMVLRPKTGVIDSSYFPFFISSDTFMETAIRISVGGLSPTINWKDLAKQEFELPSLEEQKNLADKLWAAYRLKEAYKKLLIATDEMVKSQFIEMFGNPTNETVGKLGNELFSFASGKANIKSNLDPSFQYNCYGGNGITGKSKEYLLKDKTIVIGRVGEYCGCVHQTSDYCWVTDNAIYLKTYSDIYRFKFIYYMFVMMDFHRYASETGQPKITQAPLLSCTYPIPTLEAQDIFISIAEQADKSKFGDFKSQFIEMFGNPLSLNQKNELKRLGECCILNPRRPNIALCDTDKVSFIPMPAVSEDGYLVDMTDEEYGKVKKGFTYFENNDVLFAKITPCMENGKGAIVHGLTNGIGMGSTEFHVLRPINGISSPYWLLALTRMPIFRERAAKNMSGTGGQKRVSASYLDHFMVGLPAIEEQRRFEAIYRQADKSKSVIQKALVYLNDIQSDELGKIA